MDNLECTVQCRAVLASRRGPGEVGCVWGAPPSGPSAVPMLRGIEHSTALVQYVSERRVEWVGVGGMNGGIF